MKQLLNNKYEKPKINSSKCTEFNFYFYSKYLPLQLHYIMGRTLKLGVWLE